MLEFDKEIEKNSNLGLTVAIYKAPPLIIRHPEYDLLEYINYFIQSYRDRGFGVRLELPNNIYVFWNTSNAHQKKIYELSKIIAEDRDTRRLRTKLPQPGQKIYLPVVKPMITFDGKKRLPNQPKMPSSLMYSQSLLGYREPDTSD